jgi:hypothetical protein
MNDADRDAIQDLFARLRAAEATAPNRDPAAEAYIRDRLEQNPSAAYYMAQTVIAQERALKAASQRLGYGDEARAPEPRRSGLLGGLFGGGRDEAPPRTGPWGQPSQASPMAGGMFGRGNGGGGFLAGAAQTAAGVAGGVVLGNMLTDLFDGDEGAGHGFAGIGGDGEERHGLFGGGESAGFGADDGGDFDNEL